MLPRKPTHRPESLVADHDSRGVVLSVIIPSHNARDLLAACLDSLYANPPTASFEIIVVDDASIDQTYEMVHTHYPEVRLLRNDQNVRYGRSNNRAINMARGWYMYMLNNDTIMLPGALDAMLDFLEQHPDAGAVGSKLLNEDGSLQWTVKSLPNPMSALFGGRSIITRLYPNNPFSRKHLLQLSGDQSRPFVAPYISSASVMMPHYVVERVGDWDERLTYHVDADYCKRISNAGWKVYYLPTATVIHLNHKGGTLVNRKRRFRAVMEFHLGSYIYYRKHSMRSAWSPMHLAVILGLGGRFLVSLTLQVVREMSMEIRGRFSAMQRAS